MNSSFDRRRFLAALGCGASAVILRIPASALDKSSAEIAHDPDRPEYHLLPPHNWMNDPNGPIWWKGKYHLFYQLNPHAAVWGDMHWGHAVSTDMVHWRHEPIALAPTPGGPDSEGCFSGSAVVYNGTPTFIYTGDSERARQRRHHPRSQKCLARNATPRLRRRRLAAPLE